MLQNLKKFLKRVSKIEHEHIEHEHSSADKLYNLLETPASLPSLEEVINNLNDCESEVTSTLNTKHLKQIITLLKQFATSSDCTLNIKDIAKDSLNRGDTLYNKKNYISAIKSFNIMIILGIENEDISKAFYYKGLSLYSLRKYMEATSCFHEIIDTYSGFSEIARTYHYKGMCLYALKKYYGAANCFEKVITEYSDSIKISAYLYNSFCQEKLGQYSESLKCLEKVKNMQDNSGYGEGEQVIIDMANRALKINIIKHFDFAKLLEHFNYINSKDTIDKPDEIGKTILMYAVEHHKLEIVEELLKIGANPIITDKYNNSALSIAFRNQDENIVKLLLSYFNDSSIEISDLLEKLNGINIDTTPGKLSDKISHYIEKHNLSSLLGLDTEAANVFYADAKASSEILALAGEFSNSSISKDYD